MRILKYILVISIVSFLFSGCGKEEENEVLPVYPVNFKINLKGVDAILKTPGTYREYVRGSYPVLTGESLGYGGLIVVNSIYATNVPDLFAFDLSCPNEKAANIRVKASDDGTAKCEKCGRIYNLMENGRVKDESSGLHLQRYRVVNTSETDVYYIIR